MTSRPKLTASTHKLTCSSSKLSSIGYPSSQLPLTLRLWCHPNKLVLFINNVLFDIIAG